MDGYIGEIRGYAGNFCPRSWAYCYGQTIQITTNTALFSILGTTYGGNGQTTFMLPDLRGRVPVGTGQGTGLLEYWNLGETLGKETITIGLNNLPSHSHAATTAGMTISGNAAGNISQKCCKEEGDKGSATGNCPASVVNGYANIADSSGNMGAVPVNLQVNGSVAGTLTVGATGGSASITNFQPSLGIGWIICLYGLYPTRD